MATIDELIAVLRQRLKQARRAKRLFGNDPALADSVALALAQAPLLTTVDFR
jgi:hypothetical protein